MTCRFNASARLMILAKRGSLARGDLAAVEPAAMGAPGAA
jgi:hypothetical protein